MEKKSFKFVCQNDARELNSNSNSLAVSHQHRVMDETSAHDWKYFIPQTTHNSAREFLMRLQLTHSKLESSQKLILSYSRSCYWLPCELVVDCWLACVQLFSETRNLKSNYRQRKDGWASHANRQLFFLTFNSCFGGKTLLASSDAQPNTQQVEIAAAAEDAKDDFL